MIMSWGERGVGRGGGGGGLSLFVPTWYSLLPLKFCQEARLKMKTFKTEVIF